LFIRVLLADDSRIMRDAIRSFLSRNSEIALVGEAVDFSQTIGMVCDLSRWTRPRGVEHHELIPRSEAERSAARLGHARPHEEHHHH
jgi:hypothetical protein